MKKVKLLCLGNEFRQDDAVCLLIGDRIKKRNIDCVEILKPKTKNLIQFIDENDDLVIAVACVKTGLRCGEIIKIEDIRKLENFNGFVSPLGIQFCIELKLIRNIGKMPKRLIVYCIEGKRFKVGKCICREVRRAAHKVIDEILSILKEK